MLLHTLVPLTRSTSLVPSCTSSPRPVASACSLRIIPQHPSSLAAAECAIPLSRLSCATDHVEVAQCNLEAHSRGLGGARDGPLIEPLVREKRLLYTEKGSRGKLSEIRSLGVNGTEMECWGRSTIGGSPQLRAAHVASVSHREQLRLSPGWPTRHCSPSPRIHSSFLRRPPGSFSSASPSPSLSPRSSASASPAATPSSPRSSSRSVVVGSMAPLLRKKLGGFFKGTGSSGGVGLKGSLPTLSRGGWVSDCQQEGSKDTTEFQADATPQPTPGTAGTSESESKTMSEAKQNHAGSKDSSTEKDASAEVEPTWKQRRETNFEVVGVPGDGRCLFMSVVYGLCHVSGNPLPSSYTMRCQWADKLRHLVADEFVKWREETEWFLEGNFEDYVANIRKPYVWGGEPELLMLSHVLRYPISVYIKDPSGGIEDGIIPIAEYGQDYVFSPDGGMPDDVEVDDSRLPRPPICVLYNGHNHYDSVHLLPLE